MKKISLLMISLLLIWTGTRAQVEFEVSEESTMTISGTSTIHDWTSTVNEIKGEYVLKENILNSEIPRSGSIVENVKIVVPVKSIESPRGTTMDNKTYDALKSEEHPNIIFEITGNKITSTGQEGINSFDLAVTGDLTVAGHTESVSFEVNGQRLNRNKFWFKGSYALDMTNYEVEPPTAMFGQIKTGKEVTINFELTLVRE